MKNIILLLLLFFSFETIAQTEVEMPNLIPPSPNAQTFLKYGNYPVSNHTGIPDISIPLHTIKLKDIAVPITISYNGSGIKVDEEASRVGLGWVLNAGGIITHTIMGRYNDFDDWKYFNVPSQEIQVKDLTGIYSFSKFTIGSYKKELPFTPPQGMTKHQFYCALMGDSPGCAVPVDLAPDIFSYNFMGYSGKFIFSHSGDIIKENEDNVIITPVTSLTSLGCKKLESFTLTTPDGTKYNFSQTERSNHALRVWASSIYNSSYYLTSIKTVNGSTINFSYKKNPSSLIGVFGRTDAVSSHEVNINYSLYDVVYLDKITYPGGSVRFGYAFDRIDYSPEARLTHIYIDENGVNKSHWKFIQEYFTANAPGTDFPTINMISSRIQNSPGVNYFNDSWNKKRLKLASVEHISNEETYSYKFAYNETSLPNKLSTSIDHWGYFNGVNNYNSLTPTFWQNISHNPNVIEPVKIGGRANREASSAHNQAFILNEITYPTGGKTKFTYESNNYQVNNFENDEYKRDFMYSKESILLSANQNQGGNNIPHMVNSFKITSSNQTNFNISAKLVLDSYLYTGNPELKISIKKNMNDATSLWEYTYNSKNLPYPPVSDNRILENFWNDISLNSGTYVLFVEGSLMKQLKSIDVEGTRIIDPEEYLRDNIVGIGGGLRIKQIRSYDTNGEVAAGKNYIYTKDGSNYEPYTSGKLMFYPRYRSEWNYLGKNGLRGGGYSVGYSTVYVIDVDSQGEETGKACYEYINKPDKNLYYTWQDFSVPTLPRPNAKDENPPGIPGFKHAENGTLIKETVYKKKSTSFEKIRETSYAYNMENDNLKIVWGVLKSDKVTPYNTECFENLTALNYIVNSQNSTDWPFGYIYPVIRPTNVNLRQKTEKIYEDKIATETITLYEMNTHYLVSKETVKSNNKVLQTVKYKYPTEITTDPVMNLLTQSNRINSPVDIKQEIDGKVKQLIKEYALFNNIPQLATLKSNTGTNKALEDRITYHQYDNYGNPLHITKDDAEQVVYLWGYSGQYMIAEIKNATYEQVKTVLGVKPESLSSALTPNMSLINNLRTKLDYAHVSTFTYRPNVGVLTATNPANITTYYVYDDLGRLKEVYLMENNKKKILQSYIYGYQNQ